MIAKKFYIIVIFLGRGGPDPKSPPLDPLVCYFFNPQIRFGFPCASGE